MKANFLVRTSTIFFLAMALTGSVRAEKYFFSAQPDPPPSGPVNFSWFSGNNWFTNDPIKGLQHANALPAPGDTAQLNSGVNAAGNTIHLDTLILQPNITVSGGDFIVSTVQMHGGVSGGTTSFNTSVIEVLSEMDVLGGSCSLNSSRLVIDFGATCFTGLGGTGQLGFMQSQIDNVGEISFYPNSSSSVSGGSNLVNHSGAIISGGSNVLVTVSGNFDNSGLVQCDSGTMQISATTWSSTSGVAIFRTLGSNAVIQINSSLTIPPNTTNIFEGPGVSSLQNGAFIQGLAQVGLYDSNAMVLDPGTLQFANTVGGTGTVHVVGAPNAPNFHLANPVSVLMVNSNTSGSLTGLVVNVDSGSQFNINYAANGQSLTFNGVTVNNSGTMNWGGKGSIAMIGNATINNLAVGLFDSQIQNPSTDGTLGSGGVATGGGSFNNVGTFRKSAGVNAVLLAPDFNNTGLVDVESGQVQVYGGTSSGTFSAAPGTEVRLGAASGTRTNFLNAGVQFLGTNFVRLNQNSTIMLNGDVTLANLSLENGIIDGPGNLTVSNIFNWSGNSSMQGIGGINIPANAAFNITASGSVYQRTINNSGTTVMTNSFVGANTNVVFNNLAGGLLETRNSGGFGFPNPTPNPTPVLNNFGTIRDVSPNTAPLAFIITNRGTVLVLSNRLNCYAYQQISGTTTVASNATFNPLGVVIQGGTVSGSGTLQGSSVDNFVNSGGVVSPGNSPGILTMASGSYTQTVAGALSIVIGGTNVGSQYSRLVLSAGSLNGTLNVSFTNSFQPSVGDSYYIVATSFFGAVSGAFSTLNGLYASNGIVLVPVYGGFGVTLVAAIDPVLTSLNRSGNQFSFNYPTTTNITNVVEYTDSLSPPLWKPFATNTGDGTVKSATDPFATNANRFYRVRLR